MGSMLPHWVEWLLALIVGFLLMEAVRYWFNHLNAALMSALRPERGTETGSQPSNQSGVMVWSATDGGAAEEAPPTAFK